MTSEPAELPETVVGIKTDTERVVASYWCEVLKKDTFAADDDFFALGGNSMSATLVTYKLRDEFDLELPLMLIFECSTVAELAEAIDELVAKKE